MGNLLDPSVEQDMALKFDFNNMFEEGIGPREGISREELEGSLAKLQEVLQSFKEKRAKGQADWADLPHNQEEIVKDILAVAEEIKGNFDNFVVLGIGGSALGPLCLQQAINHPYYNELPKEKRQGYPRFYVMDNVDPDKLAGLLEIIDLEKTMFNVISKSGSTSETMAQFMWIVNLLREKIGSDYHQHIIATTDPEKGNLIKVAKEEGYKIFYVPPGVGGRFSEFSPVGLLPAAVCGIDIQELLAGAASMDKRCQEEDILKNPALLSAALKVIAMDKGKNISVMMPYSEALKYVSDWYAQLWAESLGKRYDIEGKEVFVGQTPVKALGATDQHSQVQLYVEGPYDKVVTFIRLDQFYQEITIPKLYEDIANIAFLGGHTFNRLIQAEQFATEFALQKAERLNNTIILPKVTPFTMGQLFYFYEMETAFAGELLNINAYDQPGVEEGKNATYALLGRPGYEEKKAELEKAPKKLEKYII